MTTMFWDAMETSVKWFHVIGLFLSFGVSGMAGIAVWRALFWSLTHLPLEMCTSYGLIAVAPALFACLVLECLLWELAERMDDWASRKIRRLRGES